MAVRKKDKPEVNAGAALIEALNLVAKEKGIDKELIYETIEASLVSACKKNFGQSHDTKVVIDRQTGEMSVYAQKAVKQELTDPIAEISLEDAREINPDCNIDDIVDVPVTINDFGRIAALAAKQVVSQKFKEAERSIIYNEYITKEHEVITGIVSRRDKRNYVIQLGKIEAVLLPGEQVPGEELTISSRVKVYVTEVKQTSKGPVISVSRTQPELVKRLFEQEVPEVSDGTVEIKSISREAGSRTKIAVSSKRDGVDPVGACVGPNGARVNIIVSELKGEKIDIIRYSTDQKEYIAAALSPSKAVEVITNEDDMTARVIVPDYQLSLAIGREGQNVRLAAKLTGWRIDIKSESQAAQIDFMNEDGEYDDDEYTEDGYDDDAQYNEDEYDAQYEDEDADDGEDGDEDTGDGE